MKTNTEKNIAVNTETNQVLITALTVVCVTPVSHGHSSYINTIVQFLPDFIQHGAIYDVDSTCHPFTQYCVKGSHYSPLIPI